MGAYGRNGSGAGEGEEEEEGQTEEIPSKQSSRRPNREDFVASRFPLLGGTIG